MSLPRAAARPKSPKPDTLLLVRAQRRALEVLALCADREPLARAAQVPRSLPERVRRAAKCRETLIFERLLAVFMKSV